MGLRAWAAVTAAVALGGAGAWLGLSALGEGVPLPSEPIAVAGVSVATEECPARCLVQLLEEDNPGAGIGAWCEPAPSQRYSCVSMVERPQAQAAECREWLVDLDRRGAVNLLEAAPAPCPGRSQEPPFGATYR